jgi:hypothetical protein
MQGSVSFWTEIPKPYLHVRTRTAYIPESLYYKCNDFEDLQQSCIAAYNH